MAQWASFDTLKGFTHLTYLLQNCLVISFFFNLSIENFRCVAAKGNESGACEKFAKYYRALCPGEWVSAIISCYLFVLTISSCMFECITNLIDGVVRV